MTGKFDGKNGPGRPRTSYLTSLKKWLSSEYPSSSMCSNRKTHTEKERDGGAA